jgi:hypothetical protein
MKRLAAALICVSCASAPAAMAPQASTRRAACEPLSVDELRRFHDIAGYAESGCTRAERDAWFSAKYRQEAALEFTDSSDRNGTEGRPTRMRHRIDSFGPPAIPIPSRCAELHDDECRQVCDRWKGAAVLAAQGRDLGEPDAAEEARTVSSRRTASCSELSCGSAARRRTAILSIN